MIYTLLLGAYNILTLLANIILTLSLSQLICKSKAMSKGIAHGFTFIIMKDAFKKFPIKKISSAPFD